jgi:hypothetical protein
MNVFVCFPSEPPLLGSTIEAAATKLRDIGKLEMETWKQIDVPGRFLRDGILRRIDNADFVVADITRLNFNVTFEIGYSIGRQKRTVLISNKGLNPEEKEITQLGIYDTIGHQSYENSNDLFSFFSSVDDISPLDFPSYELERSAPIFILDTLHKTDASIRILSKIKKSRIRFRSYDPSEQPRLATLEAYRSVYKSLAVVINLLSSNATDARFNNLRGAFLGGLAYGLGKDTVILQEGDEPVPLDYRDFVSVYKHPNDVDGYINDLVPRVAEGLQAYSDRPLETRGFLAGLDLGDPAAENEATKLAEYYVETDEFHKVLAGGVRLVVGRKGSGKTALFFRVRDILRENRRCIVLDLKPEGHQLKRFRDLVLDRLTEAVQEHATTAFWEYVLLLEVCYKVLEKDREVHVRDHTLFEPYQGLSALYLRDQLTGGDADFSERMLRLVHRISEEFTDQWGGENNLALPSHEITHLIFKHEIPELRNHLVEYLSRKDGVVVLFDNIDKGWPTRGITSADIIILRGLLEASRKLERLFQARQIDFSFSVFLRNDVYEFLVGESPDRGKESRVSLDWTDADLLRELLRRRLIYNGVPSTSSFAEAWLRISVSHLYGEDTADYLIERSLMRPRNFLRLINYCKSSAVNLGHEKFTAEDVEKASAGFSADIVNEIALEIRDVFPAAEDIPYYFIGAKPHMNTTELWAILDQTPLTAAEYDKVVEALMWFGFLGVLHSKDVSLQETYIYDVFYDMKKLQYLAGGLGQTNMRFCIHRAFWPFLEISENRK